MILVVFTGFAVCFLVVFAFRKRIGGAQFLLPLIVLGALIFAEIAARKGWIDIPPPESRPPDRQWQIDLYTDLLGNQEGKDAFVFRGRSHPKQKNGFRIICLGTSSTFGAGLRADESPYPAVLEKELRRLCPDWRGDVINAGLTGYHSFQLMILLKDVLARMSPDLVVFYYGANEGRGIQAKLYYRRAGELLENTGDLTPADRRLILKYGVRGGRGLGLAKALSEIRVLDLIKPRLSALAQERYISKLKGAPRDLPPDSREILKSMTDSANDLGFLFMMIPEHKVGGGPVNPLYAELMSESADGKRVIFVDGKWLLPEFGADFFLDQIHMNEKGHEIFGKALAHRLSDFLCGESDNP